MTDIADLRCEIAALRAQVHTLSESLYTTQGAVIRLVNVGLSRPPFVDAEFGRPRTHTETAMRRRIQRAAFYRDGTEALPSNDDCPLEGAFRSKLAKEEGDK